VNYLKEKLEQVKALYSPQKEQKWTESLEFIFPVFIFILTINRDLMKNTMNALN
jgi:hypothetical protein